MDSIDFGLVLNLHQPAGNLDELLDRNEWEAREILWALDRIPRSLWDFEDVGRVHVSLSGTLLETLSDPHFQNRVYGAVDCGSLLWHLQNTRTIDVLGGAYYHPVLPLIPPEDREEQIARWLGLGRHLFWRDRFRGFWPPELGFCMDLIPTLAGHGYEWVIVDSEHVRPLSPMSWEELRYRPHRARIGDAELIVVVRDRDLSNAQESGLEAGWFIEEVRARTRHCDFPPLVTTATDGDNGGWFRNTTHGANFWSSFYRDLADRVRAGRSGGIRPAFINDYLDRHGAHGWVTVEPGAWNTAEHHGTGFVQWTGSGAQRDALARATQLSGAVRTGAHAVGNDERASEVVEQARWRVLRAETSCNFYWGEAWVERCHRDLDDAEARLGQALHAHSGVA
jgi:4-alpha-glucanotransferase